MSSTGTTTAGAADRSAPGVSRYGVTNSPFAVGGGTPIFGSAAAKKHKKGTTFKYTLPEAATVTITISQRRAGRRRALDGRTGGTQQARQWAPAGTGSTRDCDAVSTVPKPVGSQVVQPTRPSRESGN